MWNVVWATPQDRNLNVVVCTTKEKRNFFHITNLWYLISGGQAGGGPRRGSFRRPAGAKPAAGGQRRERKAAPTAEELDAELDSYINDMKI